MIEVGITVRAATIEEVKAKLATSSDLAVHLFETRAEDGEKDRRVAQEETVKSTETTERVFLSVTAIAFETEDVIRNIGTKQIVSGGPPQTPPTQLRPVQ